MRRPRRAACPLADSIETEAHFRSAWTDSVPNNSDPFDKDEPAPRTVLMGGEVIHSPHGQDVLLLERRSGLGAAALAALLHGLFQIQGVYRMFAI